MDNFLCTLLMSLTLNWFQYKGVIALDNIKEIKLNEPIRASVLSEKVFRANFKGEKWESWSDRITIESRITSNKNIRKDTSLNIAVFYNEYSESWVLTNQSTTTLCIHQIASLIIVVQNPNTESLQPIDLELLLIPKNILLSVDKDVASVHRVSISAPLTFVVDHKSDAQHSSQEDLNLLLTVDDANKLESPVNDLVCMIVGVYNGVCPLKDREESIYTAEVWTTALARATITIDTKSLKFEGPFYVTILIAKHDNICHQNPGEQDKLFDRFERNYEGSTDENQQTVQDNTSNVIQEELIKDKLSLYHSRIKEVNVRIARTNNYISYVWPIVFQCLGMCFFIFIASVIMVLRQFGGKESCPNNSIEMVEKDDLEGSPLKGQQILGDLADIPEDKDLKIISGRSVQDDINDDKDMEGNMDSIYEDCSDGDVVDGIADDLITKVKFLLRTPDNTMNDKKRSKRRQERIKRGLSRFKAHPTLSDMMTIVDTNKWFRRNRSRVYFYIVPLLSLYYFVPAIQFAFLAKQNEVSTGSQDLCYHNFRCSRPFYIFSDFNHVVSNLSYVMFGLAFMGLVKIKQKKLPYHCFDYEVKTGILQQLSIFYAMGFSLMAQGFFSVCYHVCPTNLSLQFDTTMMYILCTLCFVKIYQFRHPDATANAYSIFMILGALVLLEALTLYSSSWWIFIVFLGFYIGMTIFIAFDIYYNGVGRLDRSITWLLAKDIIFNWKQIYHSTYRGNESSQSKSKRNFLSRIRFPDRFRFSLCFCIVNFLYASYCVYEKVKKPDKSVSHVVLFILGGNMILYLAYYIWNSRLKACKTRTISHENNVERTERDESCCSLQCCKQFLHAGSFFAISAFVLFAIGLIFYIKRSANRNLSPAESKNLNVDCTFMDFYDNHDLWHFFGAAGIFMAFCSLLTADDDLLNEDRRNIPVF